MYRWTHLFLFAECCCMSSRWDFTTQVGRYLQTRDVVKIWQQRLRNVLGASNFSLFMLLTTTRCKSSTLLPSLQLMEKPCHLSCMQYLFIISMISIVFIGPQFTFFQNNLNSINQISSFKTNVILPLLMFSSAKTGGCSQFLGRYFLIINKI